MPIGMSLLVHRRQKSDVIGPTTTNAGARRAGGELAASWRSPAIRQTRGDQPATDRYRPGDLGRMRIEAGGYREVNPAVGEYRVGELRHGVGSHALRRPQVVNLVLGGDRLGPVGLE